MGGDHNREVKRVAIILHEFFGKSMASKAVANARSVLPLDCEKNDVNAGGVKSNVTLRCSWLLPWEAVVKQVEDFVLRMRFSGYTKKFRYEVVD